MVEGTKKGNEEYGAVGALGGMVAGTTQGGFKGFKEAAEDVGDGAVNGPNMEEKK